MAKLLAALTSAWLTVKGYGSSSPKVLKVLVALAIIAGALLGVRWFPQPTAITLLAIVVAQNVQLIKE